MALVLASDECMNRHVERIIGNQEKKMFNLQTVVIATFVIMIGCFPKSTKTEQPQFCLIYLCLETESQWKTEFDSTCDGITNLSRLSPSHNYRNTFDQAFPASRNQENSFHVGRAWNADITFQKKYERGNLSFSQSIP